MRGQRIVWACGVAMFVLAGCSGSAGNKIGSTVKGVRVAVMDTSAATLKPDPGLQGVRPEVPSTVTNASWPQASYDATHVTPNAALGTALQPAWSASIGEGSSSDFKLLARPVVAQGRVISMDSQGEVRAFDTRTGKRIWRFDTTPSDSDAKAIGGGIGADDAAVYVTTGFGDVVALDAADGRVVWRRALRNPLRAAPTVANGRIYVVSIVNQLTALDAATGQVLWEHNGIAENATLMGASNPAVSGDSVVVAYGSGEIYNLRTENGRVSWTYALTSPTQVGALPAIADIRGLPVIDRGRVFAISHSGRMAAIDHRTGDRVWEADVGGIHTPLIAGDTVYVFSNDGQLVALSRGNGRVAWVQDLPRTSDPDDRDSDPVFWAGPVLGNGRLWLTNSAGELASFSPNDGQRMDTVDLGEPCYIAPIIAGKTVFAVTDDGTLVALR